MLQAAVSMSALHRKVLGLFLDRLDLIERQIQTLRESMASAMQAHQQAILRLAAVPGFGVDSAPQVIAEVGPQAATFDSAARPASWEGVSPGREESAEVSKSSRTLEGNRALRRILSQSANAAIRAKGSIFESMYRRLVPRMGHNRTIWAIAHRLCRLAWIILHQHAEYVAYAKERDAKAAQRRTATLIGRFAPLVIR